MREAAAKAMAKRARCPSKLTVTRVETPKDLNPKHNPEVRRERPNDELPYVKATAQKPQVDRLGKATGKLINYWGNSQTPNKYDPNTEDKKHDAEKRE